MSSNNPFNHWWWQRVTAIVLSFLSLYIFCHIIYDVQILKNTDFLNSHPIFCLIFFIFILQHSFLGIKVIVEDYISNILMRRIVMTFIYTLVLILHVQIVMIFVQQFFINRII